MRLSISRVVSLCLICIINVYMTCMHRLCEMTQMATKCTAMWHTLLVGFLKHYRWKIFQVSLFNISDYLEILTILRYGYHLNC